MFTCVLLRISCYFANFIIVQSVLGILISASSIGRRYVYNLHRKKLFCDSVGCC